MFCFILLYLHHLLTLLTNSWLYHGIISGPAAFAQFEHFTSCPWLRRPLKAVATFTRTTLASKETFEFTARHRATSGSAANGPYDERVNTMLRWFTWPMNSVYISEYCQRGKRETDLEDLMMKNHHYWRWVMWEAGCSSAPETIVHITKMSVRSILYVCWDYKTCHLITTDSMTASLYHAKGCGQVNLKLSFIDPNSCHGNFRAMEAFR